MQPCAAEVLSGSEIFRWLSGKRGVCRKKELRFMYIIMNINLTSRLFTRVVDIQSQMVLQNICVSVCVLDYYGVYLFTQ